MRGKRPSDALISTRETPHELHSFPLIRIISGKNRSALIWAERAHRGQERSEDVPYLLHLFSVASLLSGAGADRNLVCAGCLHDIVEDTEVSLEEVEEEFGREVRELVEAVTKDKEFKGLPLEEQASLVLEKVARKGQEAIALKAADLTSNLTDSVLDAEKRGKEHWAKTYKSEERAQRKLNHYLELSRGLQIRLKKYPRLKEALEHRTSELQELMQKEGWL